MYLCTSNFNTRASKKWKCNGLPDPRSPPPPSHTPQCNCAVVSPAPAGPPLPPSQSHTPAWDCRGELRIPMASIAPLPPNERRVIAHRALAEVASPSWLVNLGVGMPEVGGQAGGRAGNYVGVCVCVCVCVMGGVRALAGGKAGWQGCTEGRCTESVV
jgi:hypothetical protein